MHVSKRLDSKANVNLKIYDRLSNKKKRNQAVQIDHSIEYNLRNICLQINAGNKAGRLVPDIFMFLRKALYKVKASIQHLIFNIF